MSLVIRLVSSWELLRLKAGQVGHTLSKSIHKHVAEDEDDIQQIFTVTSAMTVNKIPTSQLTSLHLVSMSKL